MISDDIKAAVIERACEIGFGGQHCFATPLEGHSCAGIPRTQSGGASAAAADAPRPDRRERFRDFVAIVDAKMPDYNANFVIGDRVIVGEGPYNQYDYSNMQRFMRQVVLNPTINLQQVIVLGEANHFARGMMSFADYFSSDKHFSDVTVSVSNTQFESDVFTSELKVSDEGAAAQTVHVTQFPSWQDMGTLDFSDDLVLAHLLQLHQLSQSQTTFIHCTAGLGRSGVLVTAFAVLNELEKIQVSDDKAQSIIDLWQGLNRSRPGLIQKKDQMENMLDMVVAIHDFTARLGEEAVADFIERTIAERAVPLASDADSGDYEEDGSRPGEDEIDSDDEAMTVSTDDAPPPAGLLAQFGVHRTQTNSRAALASSCGIERDNPPTGRDRLISSCG